MILKRTKIAEGPPPEKRPVTTTHYATKIDADGNVTQWEQDPSKACSVDEATATKVKEQYADRPKSGKFELVKGEGVKEPVRSTAPEEVLSQKLISAKKVHDDQKAEIARLRDTLTNANAENLNRINDLSAEVTLLKEENERLKAIANAPKQP